MGVEVLMELGAGLVAEVATNEDYYHYEQRLWTVIMKIYSFFLLSCNSTHDSLKKQTFKNN